MKIKVKEIINSYYFKDEKKYKLVSQDYCCPQMAYATEDNRTKLVTENDGSYENIGLHPAWEIIFVDTSLDYDDSSDPTRWDDECKYEIHYCPFCGKPIEIEIINSEDITDQYTLLSKRRSELNEKSRKTDSKKKEQELSSEIRDLDKQIEEMC